MQNENSNLCAEEIKAVLLKYGCQLGYSNGSEKDPHGRPFTHFHVLAVPGTFPYNEKDIATVTAFMGVELGSRQQFQAIFICEFVSFSQWVNKASSRLGGIRGEELICLDANGMACVIGEDFMAARDNNTFPVRCYKLTRAKEYKK